VTVEVNRGAISRILHSTGGPVGNRLYITGLKVHNDAKRLCPVDKGRLRSSIQVTRPVPRGADQLVVRVGTNVRYALFVHNGTRYLRGRPFLSTALAREIT
jgi:hypothetical protein